MEQAHPTGEIRVTDHSITSADEKKVKVRINGEVKTIVANMGVSK